ncbi:MAG: hypothetical protein RRY39_08175 [Odoribacter sp.]
MVNYSVSAKSNITIQGIGVVISTEYQQGNLPTVLSARASGQVAKKPQQDPVTYMDLSASYNVEAKSFNNCNGSNVPVGFIQELELKIVETYEQIKLGTEVKA